MLDGSTAELPDDLSQMPETAGDSAQAPQGGGSGNFSGQNGNGQFVPPNGAQGAREGHGEGGSGNAALLIAQYVSIIALFGAATAGIVKVFGKKKNGKSDAEAAAVVVAEKVD